MTTIITEQEVGDVGDIPDFNAYVLKYHEIIHSGIGANINRLNLTLPYTIEQRTEALNALKQYANTSITAYRSIEWLTFWNILPIEWITQGGKSTLPLDILAKITKPTRYSRPTVEIVEIKDDTL